MKKFTLAILSLFTLSIYLSAQKVAKTQLAKVKPNKKVKDAKRIGLLKNWN